jgi:uncharacterized protein
MNSSFRAALAVSLSIVLSTVIGSWSFLSAKKLTQSIEVTGSAKKRIKSDLIIWQTSVATEAPTLPEAYSKLTRDVEKVKVFLIAHGIPENQIAISAVETTPVLREKRSGYQPETEGTSLTGAVSGYHLKQSLAVRSSEIDKITAISRQVTELINQGILLDSEAPEYLYTRLAETKVEILADAARDARERAKQIATSTGGKIGDIRSASMGVLQITAADASDVSEMGVNDTKSLEKDITAVVHMTFAIQ